MPRLIPAFAGALACAVLAGCYGDDEARKKSADIPSVKEQVDRSRKADRLAGARAVLPETSRKTAAAPVPRVRPFRDTGPLSRFYRALSDLRSGLGRAAVTVLHLGDSHIAADGFSGDLRALFQARFGDAGRGAVMPGYPFPYYRARGVTFAREGDWDAANSFAGDPGPYGISGVRLTAREQDARLTLATGEGPAEWAEVAFLARPGGGGATVEFGGTVREISTQAAKTAVKRVRIPRKGRELSVTAKGGAPVSILSWSVGQNRPGLRYVNFGIPGATADTPSRWDEALVADDLARLKPDLIVLGYGTNEGFNDALDPEAYASRVEALIGRLRRHAPQASLLVLGPPDGARFPKFARAGDGSAPDDADCRPLSEAEAESYSQLKAAGADELARWHAPPSLAQVRSRLEQAARETGALFWDWSNVMGGPCGIHDWAQAEPQLAAGDHVHLRSAGAERSARALFRELMAGYDAHLRLASR